MEVRNNLGLGNPVISVIMTPDFADSLLIPGGVPTQARVFINENNG
jgi:hypothetical protein